MKKGDIKELEQIAAALPFAFETVQTKSGKKEVAVNHLSRLKKVLISKGQKGLTNYVNEVIDKTPAITANSKSNEKN